MPNKPKCRRCGSENRIEEFRVRVRGRGRGRGREVVITSLNTVGLSGVGR
jgi:hypothetical protein